MMLIKQVGLMVNILNCKLKKHIASVFKSEGINLTAEQFLVMDTLWNQGEMTQQSIAYLIQKDKNSVTQFIDNLEKKGYKKDSYFKLVHIGSGCGNMLGHIHYLYPNAELAGVEENDAARKFAISCIPVYPNIDSLPRKLEEYDIIAHGLG